MEIDISPEQLDLEKAAIKYITILIVNKHGR
jgi:hypothetical protein